MRPVRMDIYQTSIPMRGFKHAAAERATAEAIVVGVHFDDGTVGWGETLPRPYVTGESMESVIEDLQKVIWPRWAGRTMPEGADAEEVAPSIHEGRCINAAICAFDLACSGRLFANVQQMSPDLLQRLSGRSQVRREIDVAVSGVVGAVNSRKVRRKVRSMQWWGMEHFKLKATDDQAACAAAVQAVVGRLGRSLRDGRSSLRVDANGSWSSEDTPQRIAAMKAWGVSAVEQPTYCASQELVELSRKCSLPLIADESLLTEDDADILLAEPERIWWNIRLSKNGGLWGALRLAKMAAQKGVTFVVGCMVGESSILSAAQRRLLEMGPGPRYIEGNYGRWLVRGDLTPSTVQFGYGGKIKPLPGDGLGVEIDPAKIEQYGRLVAGLRA
jgi:L-Ala-D/L-Glu epimerase